MKLNNKGSIGIFILYLLLIVFVLGGLVYLWNWGYRNIFLGGFIYYWTHNFFLDWILWPLLIAMRSIHEIFTSPPSLGIFRYLLGIFVFLSFYVIVYFVFRGLFIKLPQVFIGLQTRFQRSIQNIRKPEAEKKRLEKRERDEQEIEED